MDSLFGFPLDFRKLWNQSLTCFVDTPQEEKLQPLCEADGMIPVLVVLAPRDPEDCLDSVVWLLWVCVLVIVCTGQVHSDRGAVEG